MTRSENRGYGGASRSGFVAAEKEFVFYTDGDGQFDVVGLRKVLEQMDPGLGWSMVTNSSAAIPPQNLDRQHLKLVCRWLSASGSGTSIAISPIRRSLWMHPAGFYKWKNLHRAGQENSDVGVRDREAPVNDFPRQYGRRSSSLAIALDDAAAAPYELPSPGLVRTRRKGRLGCKFDRDPHSRLREYAATVKRRFDGLLERAEPPGRRAASSRRSSLPTGSGTSWTLKRG